MRKYPLGVTVFLIALLSAGSSTASPLQGPSSSRQLHDIIKLKRDHFLAFEQSGPAVVEIERCCHGEGQASVSLSTFSDTAQEDADFTSVTRTVTFTQPVSVDEVSIPLNNDEEVESLERLEVKVENATGGASISFPSLAQITIIDNDGPARISMLTPSEEVFENRGPLELTVVRSGDVTGSATIAYSTADSTSTAGEDYVDTSGTLTFGAGERLKRVKVSMIDDTLSEGFEDLAFTLSSPQGAELATPATTVINIADDEHSASDTTSPITAFHQPLHGKTYGARAARDVLIFADDEGSGVRYVDFAIQQKMRSGLCRWYARGQKRFVRGPCKVKKWVRLPGAEVAVHTLPDILRSSVPGNRVRFYKAFSRGIDELGNIEKSLELKRNVSRFDIR